jgi:hypothetical protein
LISYLSEDTCPVANLFIDWNPIYDDRYDTAKGDANELHRDEDDPSLFSKLISDAKKL